MALLKIYLHKVIRRCLRVGFGDAVMIAVVGLGYIGLTVALGFAELGEDVYGVEIDEFRADLIRRSKIPYYETGLDEALNRHINNNFHVLGDIDDVPNGVDVFMICVGTPKVVNDQVDYSKLFQALDDVIDTGFDNYFTIAIKTSLPPGTMDNIVKPYFEERDLTIGQDIGLAFCPEFVREGKCWDDFINPSRIAIGVENERDRRILESKYSSFNAPVVAVNYKTAEFMKYLTSSLLATMISYSNEMAEAARVMGNIDIAEAFKILQLDRRWYDNTMRGYVYPGCGFGGVNLPKDLSDFIRIAAETGAETPLLEQVHTTNELLPHKICELIAKEVPAGSKLAILGLTFKEGSGDVRNSVSAKLIDILTDMGYSICAYDPIANEDFAQLYRQNISYASSLKEACNKSDAIVIATPWKQFRIVPEMAAGKPIFDLRYHLES